MKTQAYKHRLLFCLLFMPFAAARADYIQPGLVSVRTKAYTPSQKNFPLGTYLYSVNWQGIPVANASVTVTEVEHPEGDAGPKQIFNVAARANSGRFISIFYSLRHLSESTFRGDDFSPMRFYSVQTENSKTKSREVSFGKDGDIRSTLWKKGNPAPEEEINFHSDNTTFDPISAAFLARSLPATEGESFTFDVFNGKHRFLITLSIVGREMIDVGGKQREAFKVVPTVKKLTDTDGEKRLRAATLWISTDEKREVLKLKSEVAVGSVNAELEEFVPAPPTLPAASARAALGTSNPDEAPESGAK